MAKNIPPTDADNDSSQPCPYCCESVNIKARLCKHCSKDISWTRYLGISNTTLALITALIAVTGTVGPTIKGLMTSKEAKISVNLIGSEDGKIVFLIQNWGGKPAAISRAQIRFPDKYHKTVVADLTASSGASVVDPGRIVVSEFKYKLGTILPTEYQTKNSDLPCKFKVEGVSDGAKILIEKEILDCTSQLLDFSIFTGNLYREKNLVENEVFVKIK